MPIQTIPASSCGTAASGARWHDRLALVLTLLVLAVLTGAGAAAVWFAPSGVAVAAVELRAGPVPVTMSTARLGLRGGVDLRFRFAEGRWWVMGDRPGLPVALETDASRADGWRGWLPLAPRALDLVLLTAGTRLRLGDAVLLVRTAADGLLEMTDGATTARWSVDGGLAVDGGLSFFACSTQQAVGNPLLLEFARTVRQARAAVAGWLDRDGRALFTIGGAVSSGAGGCWGVAGVPPGWARVRRSGGEFRLDAAGPVLVEPMQAGGAALPSFRQWTALNGPEGRATHLVIGRSRFALEMTETRLRLTAMGRPGLLPENREVPEGNDIVESDIRSLSWIGAGASSAGVWGREAVGAVAAAVLATMALAFRRRMWRAMAGSPPGAARQPLALVLAGWPGAVGLAGAALVAAGGVGAGVFDRGILLALTPLAWGWATVVGALSRRMVGRGAWYWLLLTVAFGGGVVVLVQLGTGSGHRHWFAAAVAAARSAFLLALLAGVLMALLPVPRLMPALDRLLMGENASPWVRGAMLGLAVALAALFILHALAGTEEGLFQLLQPAEAAKTVYLLCLSWLGMKFLSLTDYAAPNTRWKGAVARMIVMVMLLSGVLSAVFLAVADMSPVALLLGIGLAWLAACSGASWRLWRSAAARRTRWALLPGVVLLVTLAGGLAGAMLLADGLRNPGTMPFGRVVRERMEILSRPSRYPQTAEQLLTAYRHVEHAPWWPKTLPFGRNGDEVFQSAVENDFIGVFLIVRFGKGAAVALIAAQAAMVLVLLSIGWAALGRSRPLHRFLGLYAIGFAAALALQWLVAWGNVLGGLVMGQAMTYVSAGFSHAVLFGVPGALVVLFLCASTADSVAGPAEAAAARGLSLPRLGG